VSSEKISNSFDKRLAKSSVETPVHTKSPKY
jgi:hypothetical protein